MEYLGLVFLHVVFGVVWAGGGVVLGLFVIPSVVEAGPAGGAVMAGVMKRKLPIMMTVAGLVTVLTGARIYFVRFSTEWLRTPEGIAITIGALLAIEAMIIGIFVQKPVAQKIGALGARMASAGRPPTPEESSEMRALQGRLRVAATVSAWSVLGAAILMAAHRLATMF